MPSSPVPQVSSPAGGIVKSRESRGFRERESKESSKDAPRTAHKPKTPSSPRRTQSYTPRGCPKPPNVSAAARPLPPRRHTTQPQMRTQPKTQPKTQTRPDRASRPLPSPPSSPLPSREAPHVLIPVPIRAKDAQSPSFIRAPPGQHVDFVFSPPKKRGLIGRLLDSVEWGDQQDAKPYQYRKPIHDNSSSRPFYKRILS